jgi:hypothetical protein
MTRQDIIDGFLLDFKPKKDQSSKSCYFYTHHLKHKHKIDAEMLEGISKINKIDYWVVKLDGQDIDIHAKATGTEPDSIENPDVVWSLEDFEKDNF